MAGLARTESSRYACSASLETLGTTATSVRSVPKTLLDMIADTVHGRCLIPILPSTLRDASLQSSDSWQAPRCNEFPVRSPGCALSSSPSSPKIAPATTEAILRGSLSQLSGPGAPAHGVPWTRTLRPAREASPARCASIEEQAATAAGWTPCTAPNSPTPAPACVYLTLNVHPEPTPRFVPPLDMVTSGSLSPPAEASQTPNIASSPTRMAKPSPGTSGRCMFRPPPELDATARDLAFSPTISPTRAESQAQRGAALSMRQPRLSHRRANSANPRLMHASPGDGRRCAGRNENGRAAGITQESTTPRSAPSSCRVARSVPALLSASAAKDLRAADIVAPIAQPARAVRRFPSAPPIMAWPMQHQMSKLTCAQKPERYATSKELERYLSEADVDADSPAKVEEASSSACCFFDVSTLSPRLGREVEALPAMQFSTPVLAKREVPYGENWTARPSTRCLSAMATKRMCR